MSVNYLGEFPAETQYEFKSNNCKTYKTDTYGIIKEIALVMSSPLQAKADNVFIKELSFV